MKHSRLLLGKKVLELIQDYYTETRILRVTVGDGLSTQNEELIINGINAAGEIVNDMTLGEYDLVVSSKPARDNYEDSQFANALQMREAGVLVPDDVVIRASQLDNKHEIADRVAQLQGVAPPTEEEIRAAQKMQEFEFQMMQLEAQKMQGEVMELNGRAQMHFAKAAQLEGEAQVQAYEAGMTARQAAQELAAKLQMFYDDLQNKLQLAGIHAGVKREGQIMSEATKNNVAELNLLAKALPAGNQNA
jgi:phosphoribosylanthranilate isomerase